MEELSKIDEIELGVLADLHNWPRMVMEYAAKCHLTHEMFHNTQAAKAWEKIENLPRAEGADMPDPIDIERAILDSFDFGDQRKIDEFTGRISDSPPTFQKRVRDIVNASYMRNVNEAIERGKNLSFSQNGYNAQYGQFLVTAIQDVPAPQLSRAKDEETKVVPACDEIPEELLHVPGFIDDLVSHALVCARRPNRTLAFAGAIALLAHLAARRFTDLRGTRTNLYVVALAPTGGGKEDPRRMNRAVLAAANYSMSCPEQIASGEAIEDYLFRCPAMLLQMDEIHTTLNSLKNPANTISHGIYKYLLSFYSASGNDHPMRLKASSSRSAGDDFGRVIHYPSLTILGTSVPTSFYQSLTEDALLNGLAGRLLVFQSNVRVGPNEFESAPPDIPSSVRKVAEECAAFTRQMDWLDLPKERVLCVPYAANVNARLSAIGREADGFGNAADKNSDNAGSGLWARAFEKVSKLALLYAVSENIAHPVVTLAGVEWAWTLVKALTRQMLAQAHINMTTGAFDAACKKVIKVLKNHPKDTLRSDIMKRTGIDSDTMNRVQDTLVERGDITLEKRPRNSVSYTLTDQGRKA